MKRRAFVLYLLAFLLVGCNAFESPAPAALPTVVLDNGPTSQATRPTGSAGVTASGVVVPAQQAQIATAVGGSIKAVHITEGDQVEAGQVLVELAGQERMNAAIESANLELLSAQQARDALDKDLEANRNQALEDLNAARQAVRDAERYLAVLKGTANETDIDIARSQVIFAQNALDKAQEQFDRYKNNWNWLKRTTTSCSKALIRTW